MMRSAPTTARAVALLATGLLCAGCSGQVTPVGGGPAGAAVSSTVPTPSPPGTAPTEDDTDRGEQTPTDRPSRLEAPDTSAGPMSIASFPTPKQLGQAWDYAVDPGIVEEGYRGNGTPALERDPGEVAATAVPFGCPRTGTIPTPDLALEVDYTLGGARVIAIRSAFSDRAAATAFFTARADQLRACVGRVEVPAVGALVRHVRRLGRGVLVSERTPDSPGSGWRELAVLDGSTVVLVATELRRDGPTPRSADLRRLARRFRA
jgi:hypothetical protein